MLQQVLEQLQVLAFSQKSRQIKQYHVENDRAVGAVMVLGVHSPELDSWGPSNKTYQPQVAWDGGVRAVEAGLLVMVGVPGAIQAPVSIWCWMDDQIND